MTLALALCNWRFDVPRVGPLHGRINFAAALLVVTGSSSGTVDDRAWFASVSDRNGFDVILTFHSLAFHHDSLFFARFVFYGRALDMLEGRSVCLFAS